MAKVVKLQQPKTATVELAEKLLADCKAGKVTAFAVALVTEQAPYTASRSAGKGDTLSNKLLVAAIEELQQAYTTALRG